MPSEIDEEFPADFLRMLDYLLEKQEKDDLKKAKSADEIDPNSIPENAKFLYGF